MNVDANESARSESAPKRVFAVFFIALALALAVGLAIGRTTGSRTTSSAPSAEAGAGGIAGSPAASEASGQEPQHAAEYVCPMHPQIRQDHPGLCPICHMDLVPVGVGGSAESEISLQPSPRAVALMNVQTERVRRGAQPGARELLGEVALNEDAESVVSAWTSGRIDRLFVGEVGARVVRGQALYQLYSPEVSVALSDMRRAAARSGAGASDVLERSGQAARARLRQFGLSDYQIDAYARAEEVPESVTIHARVDGTVVERDARVGQWVERGTTLLRLASLDEVWAQLDVYERDLPSVRPGATVELRVRGAERDAEPFVGAISFVDPVVDPTTRTARARVVLENADGALRPGMYVRATIGGASAGHEATGSAASEAVTVPESSVLWTGPRSLVYVYDPSESPPVYMPVEVELGARAAGRVEILAGVFPGEYVVTNGAFRLDASLQIKGGRTMMARSSGSDPAAGHQHGAGGAASDGDGEAEGGRP